MLEYINNSWTAAEVPTSQKTLASSSPADARAHVSDGVRGPVCRIGVKLWCLVLELRPGRPPGGVMCLRAPCHSYCPGEQRCRGWFRVASSWRPTATCSFPPSFPPSLPPSLLPFTSSFPPFLFHSVLLQLQNVLLSTHSHGATSGWSRLC